MAGSWPVHDFLEFGPLPGAVPSARLHARHILWEWSLTSLRESVEQVITELMSNAIAAARAVEPIQPVGLWLLTDGRQVLVLVWDANPQPPARIQPDTYAEGGRGLLLVEAYSARWGSYPDVSGGKVVWALCETIKST
jgi:anti-sigma regulatory factor (Ser/Thr protein kinase)